MSPFVAYHATMRRHRASIRRCGLLASRPSHGRPCGVYVYRDDYGHLTRGRFPFSTRWGHFNHGDLWQVAYIGPLVPDQMVENGLILLERVAPQCISLITHITPTPDE